MSDLKKICDNSVQAQDNIVQSRNNIVHSQDNIVHSQDNTVHSQDNIVHSQDNIVHSQDNIVHSQDNTVHSQDNIVHSQDNIVHSQDNIVHSQDNIVHSLGSTNVTPIGEPQDKGASPLVGDSHLFAQPQTSFPPYSNNETTAVAMDKYISQSNLKPSLHYNKMNNVGNEVGEWLLHNLLLRGFCWGK